MPVDRLAGPVAQVGGEPAAARAKGIRLTAARPPRRPGRRAEGEQPAAELRAAARRVAARLPQPEAKNATVASRRVEARLGVPGEELERDHGRQPGAGEQVRAGARAGR